MQALTPYLTFTSEGNPKVRNWSQAAKDITKELKKLDPEIEEVGLRSLQQKFHGLKSENKYQSNSLNLAFLSQQKTLTQSRKIGRKKLLFYLTRLFYLSKACLRQFQPSFKMFLLKQSRH